MPVFPWRRAGKRVELILLLAARKRVVAFVNLRKVLYGATTRMLLEVRNNLRAQNSDGLHCLVRLV